jgi:hypothetical protein
VYASNSFQPAPPAYPRRFVISIHKFTGDKVISNGMLGVDRENFRKILYGGSVPNLSSNTGGSLGLQWTQVRKPYNFAVTDFAYGTLIFLQDDLSDKNKIKPPFCFSLNVRDMFVTVYSLYSFVRQAKAALAGSRAAELRDNADAILHQLPDKYTNEVCKTLFLYHSGLAPYK